MKTKDTTHEKKPTTAVYAIHCTFKTWMPFMATYDGSMCPCPVSAEDAENEQPESEKKKPLSQREKHQNTDKSYQRPDRETLFAKEGNMESVSAQSVIVNVQNLHSFDSENTPTSPFAK